MSGQKKNGLLKGILPYTLLVIVIIGVAIFYKSFSVKINKIDYNKLTTELANGEVEKLEVTPKSGAGIYFLEGRLKSYRKNETFRVTIPLSDSVIDNILTLANENDLSVETKTNPENGTWMTFLVYVVPVLVVVGAMVFLVSRLGQGGKGSFDFGRSKAKLSNEEGKTTFKDVAGLKEEKEEVQELIDFLKNPKKFTKLGARIPSGVLLVGPPGTGKTLLAKAVAGEAKVPFYYISGSDFVELFVGVGASRVRDMFKQAKQTAPCLIFIDEIDAVGRQRGTGLGGGHDEREQTLNQLLTEMDGFGENEGIIIIAATNRPDVLDPALLRPGRFDRQVTVTLPDVREREEILAVHARNKVLDGKVKLSAIAKRTPGFSGAGLENLLNEAALLAVRRDKENITMEEIDEAADRVLMGPAKTSRKPTEFEKRIVAYHEAGHAVAGKFLPNGEEVNKITIVARGMAGGYNLLLPKEERTLIYTKKEMLDKICTLLAGRVAEEVFMGEQSTGASDDFKRATKIARKMVSEYGMSELGTIQFEESNGDVFLGRDYVKARNFSDKVALEIDQAQRKIIDECYRKTTEILNKNKKYVEKIALVLIEKETLTKEEIDKLFGKTKKTKKVVKKTTTKEVTEEDK